MCSNAFWCSLALISSFDFWNLWIGPPTLYCVSASIDSYTN